MTTGSLLRIASIVTFLYCAGHTAGVPWTPARGLSETAVLDGMKTIHFRAGGSERTYWDFYFGFGIAISFYLLVQAVALWQLARLAKTNAARLRPTIASFALAFLINAIIAWKFFFLLPAVLALIIAVSLGFAFFAAHERGSEGVGR